MHVSLVCGIYLEQGFALRLRRLIDRVWGIVLELSILHQMPDHVDTKAVDAHVHPESKHGVERRPNLWIAPVEVGLLLQEGVVIILAGRLIPFPGAAPE